MIMKMKNHQHVQDKDHPIEQVILLNVIIVIIIILFNMQFFR
jgi:hypothetical protein